MNFQAKDAKQMARDGKRDFPARLDFYPDGQNQPPLTK
jgi:hypothetical protein